MDISDFFLEMSGTSERSGTLKISGTSS